MKDSPIFNQVNIVVSDMEATVSFYRRLGLSVPDTEESFQAHHRTAELSGGIDLDFDSIEFARHWDTGLTTGAAVIGFRVESRERVDTIYADLTAGGYRGQQEPYDAFWGAVRGRGGPGRHRRWDHEPSRPIPALRSGLSMTGLRSAPVPERRQ
jgi:catechol 2,3-dioxygenase-like lactoylglutathione lyase family enzyme